MRLHQKYSEANPANTSFISSLSSFILHSVIPRKDWFDLAQSFSEKEWDRIDVIIQGVPYDEGSVGRRGAYLAPDKLRALSRTGWAVAESGELIDRIRLTDVGDIRIGRDREAFHRFVAQRFTAFPKSAFLLHLGGDHSISIPLVKAFGLRERGSCGLLLLDAHPDAWDSYEGNPLAHACVLRRVLEDPSFSPKKVAIVGLRSYAPEEIDFLRRNNIFYITARDFYLRGADRSAQQIIESLYEQDNIYLSLDIDVFDPAYAPGTGFPVPGGLNTRAVLTFLRLVFAKLNVVAMDLVEISPPLDSSEITSALGAKIILEVLGFLQARKGRFAI